jgi:serine/threonine-protein kinase
MSPEQINGSATLDGRSDLYSVGVSLYELVTGKRPFDGDSQFAIMSAHLQQTPVPPIQLDPTLPPALNEIILLSVNRDPNARFQKAEAFFQALASVVPAPAPATAPAPARAAVVPAGAAATPPAAQPAKSRRALWATVGALCVVGVLVAAIQFGPWKKAAADSPASPPTAAATPAPVSPAPAPVSPAPTSTEPVAASVPAAIVASPQPSAPEPATAKRQQPVVTPSRQSATPGPTSAPVAAAPSTPVQAPAPQPSPQTPVQQAAPQPDLSAQRAELQKVRTSLVMISARANSIHSTLDNLQRRQAASGLGLRGDWLQSATLMDSFLSGAGDALQAGDAAGARDLMEKGERQVEKLEKALNK